MTNQEKTAELRGRLDSLQLGDVSASTIGHAAYAWLGNGELAYSTADAAAQQVALVRKGATIGERNQERIGSFLSMLQESADPAATVVELSARNGHVLGERPNPIGAVKIEEEPKKEPALTPPLPQELVPLMDNVRSMYDTAKAEVDRLQEELREKRAVANQLMGILKAAGVEERAKYDKKAPEKKKRPSHASVSDATAQKILGEIKSILATTPPALSDVPGSFTRPLVEKATGRHHSQIGAAVEKLRESGQIRAAGLVETGKGKMKTNVYAVVA